MDNQNPATFSPVELAAELLVAYQPTTKGYVTFNRVQQQALYKLAQKYGKDAVIQAYLTYVPKCREKASRISYDFVECCETLIVSEKLQAASPALVSNEPR
jgi:hypothetical protein